MPLFKCTKCGCIDNTAAAGSYWQDRENAQCAECFTGKWHDLFPKETPKEKGLIPDPHFPPFYASPKNIEMVAKERKRREKP